MTSVPALPATSAIETILPSAALFILIAVAGAGALAPSVSGLAICKALPPG